MDRSEAAREAFNNFVAMRRLIAGSMRKMKHSRIPPSQLELLFTAAHHPGASLKELAKIMQLTPGAITQLVEALEIQGLVERQISAKDRRSSQLALTTKGNAEINALREIHKQLFQDMTSALTEDEIKSLLTIQSKMIITLKEKAEYQKG